MCQIREFEELVGRAHADGRLPGLLHLSIGGEAVAVGVLCLLRDDDRVYSSHRGHGHFLAAGEDPHALMAELAGRDTGLCRGRGGSMHLMGRRAVLATGVVGGSLPIALGHALALPPGAASVVFFGDGAVQTGVFHETLNLAALWRVPMLFVCENNGWAEFTSRAEHTAVETVAEYGRLHQIATATVDGGDVLAVRAAATTLLNEVRAGRGPAMLECQVTRIRPHYEGDLRRTDDDRNDPVERFARALVDDGIAPSALDDVRRRAALETERALTRALDDPLPDPDHDTELVFTRLP
jgi:pyruvate dehydrogenase E1 component alpha subunit